MRLSTRSYFFLVFVIFPLIKFPKSAEANGYEECRKQYQCGTVKVSYPFYDEVNRPAHCGHPGFKFICNSENGGVQEMPEIAVTTSSEKYYLLYMDPTSPTISVARKDFYSDYCPNSLLNATLDSTLFRYTDTVEYLALYFGCSSTEQPPISAISFSCSNINNTYPGGYLLINGNNNPPRSCQSSIVLPSNQSVDDIRDISSLHRAFRTGFELKWIADKQCDTCRTSGGECGYDSSQKDFICYCQDNLYDSYGYTCSKPSNELKEENFQGTAESNDMKTVQIIIASLVAGLAIIAVLLLYITRKTPLQKLIVFSNIDRRNSIEVEAMVSRLGEHAPKRYTYGEIKKMTSFFQDKLGEGGYGDVYKGELLNGCPVAVKLLKKTNCDGTEFANEVASICGTNHVNIVTFIGYCFQGSKKALVYEFMPNGSLDKYTYCGQNQNPLAWETLFQIAIGIGQGLEYLHQGCRTRILHFDIKPHNILLDAKFCPKISDFGLSKPCLQTKSTITMSGTRGTPGYIAPEVFCRGFGGPSHKSDVYSYGMLILDLVGCRTNNIAGSEATSSETYFPHFIYKQFGLNDVHELQGIPNDEEKALQRKLVIVGLWCVQTKPSSRPSISRALEMLEGDLDSLQIPPIPSLSSPPRPHQHDSSTDSTHTMTL